MGCSRSLTWFTLLVILFSFVSSSSSRKLLETEESRDKNVAVAPPRTYLEAAKQFLSALPKGRVPSSTPSKKGHSVTAEEKLVSRHLAEQERILRSVPSPGIGH